MNPILSLFSPKKILEWIDDVLPPLRLEEKPASLPQDAVAALQKLESPPDDPKTAFFKQYATQALATQKMTGIPASVTLAQAALESGFGLHAPQNNFFGIKGTGPAGSQSLLTWEYRQGKKVRELAKFRSYHDPLESFLDHAKLISEGRYLRHAMAHRNSPEAFVHALQSGKAKYATDPHYEAKLLDLIRRHNLQRYDLKN